jgi:hypothetical protein
MSIEFTLTVSDERMLSPEVTQYLAEVKRIVTPVADRKFAEFLAFGSVAIEIGASE